MRSRKRLICALLAMLIALFVVASADLASAGLASAETASVDVAQAEASADVAQAGMDVTASDSAEAESDAVTDDMTPPAAEVPADEVPTPAEPADQKPSPSGEGGSAEALTEEVVPPTEPTTDAPADEETTSSVSPNGEPEGACQPGLAENSPLESFPGAAASPEGEASEDPADTQKPSPSGEGGASAPEEVVPTDEPTNDTPSEEETTSSVSPDDEPASPEGEASREPPAATQKPSPDGEGAERSEAEEVSPTAEPTTAPTMEPTVAPTTAPTASPTVKPTTAPTESPEIVLTVKASKGIDVQDNTYSIPADSTGRIKFTWQYSGKHSAYRVTVTDAQKAVVYEGEQKKSEYRLSVDGLSDGRYTFKVSALSKGKAVATEKYRFHVVIVQSDPGDQPPEVPDGKFPGGDRPGGFSFGGFSGGIRFRGGSSSGMAGAEADQGFTVTPGKALTGSHSAGTGDMTPYGALAPEPAEGAMTWLTLGDTTLQITLDDGRSAFTARVEDDRLILSPEGDGEVWTLNGYAVKALNRSGIAAVELRLGAATVAFPTDLSPRGEIYAGLCAAGYVSADYAYSVSGSGVSVDVAGHEYLMDASGQLLSTEE